MKKELLLSLIFVLYCVMVSGQHLIRVNNNPAADPDYATLQAANDAASDGDTIYVEGSQTDYDGADILKKLVIIGPGGLLMHRQDRCHFRVPGHGGIKVSQAETID